jgi:hypothetical protein
VCSSDDANVNLMSSGTSQTFELLLLQDAKQFGLPLIQRMPIAGTCRRRTIGVSLRFGCYLPRVVPFAIGVPCASLLAISN